MMKKYQNMAAGIVAITLIFLLTPMRASMEPGWVSSILGFVMSGTAGGLIGTLAVKARRYDELST